jgi:hypothetical protein
MQLPLVADVVTMGILAIKQLKRKKLCELEQFSCLVFLISGVLEVFKGILYYEFLRQHNSCTQSLCNRLGLIVNIMPGSML